MPSAVDGFRSLSLNHHSVSNPTVISGPLLTWIKVKRFVYYFFGFSFLAAGIAIAVLTLSSALPLLAGLTPIPLFFSSYFLLKLGVELWDYDDPVELQTIRQKALETPLLELTSKHGWKNFFQHQLLSPQNFVIAFQHQTTMLDVNGLMQMHKRAEHGLNLAKGQNFSGEYFIPELTPYKDRFFIESRNLTCDEFVKKYPIADLERFQFISTQEADLLKRMKEKYDQAIKECKDQIGYTEGAFSDRGQVAAMIIEPLKDEFLQGSYVYQKPHNSEGHFSSIKKHLGIDILSRPFYNGLTLQQREQRLSALYFHERKLKKKIQSINEEYTRESGRSAQR